MRYLILFITVLFCFSFYKEDEVISWSKDRKLTWGDYKGKPQKRFAAASTVYSLGRKVLNGKDGAIVARISAYFYCNDSWKNVNWINESVLAHEQKHFDIVELYARKFRKGMSEMILSNFKDAEEKVDSLYEVINKEMDVFQDKYDDETNGSMDSEGQKKWNNNIDNEITALGKFQNSLVTLKIK